MFETIIHNCQIVRDSLLAFTNGALLWQEKQWEVFFSLLSFILLVILAVAHFLLLSCWWWYKVSVQCKTVGNYIASACACNHCRNGPPQTANTLEQRNQLIDLTSFLLQYMYMHIYVTVCAYIHDVFYLLTFLKVLYLKSNSLSRKHCNTRNTFLP